MCLPRLPFAVSQEVNADNIEGEMCDCFLNSPEFQVTFADAQNAMKNDTKKM